MNIIFILKFVTFWILAVKIGVIHWQVSFDCTIFVQVFVSKSFSEIWQFFWVACIKGSYFFSILLSSYGTCILDEVRLKQEEYSAAAVVPIGTESTWVTPKT